MKKNAKTISNNTRMNEEKSQILFASKQEPKRKITQKQFPTMQEQGGFGILMPNVSQVPTIFSFQRIDFWPGWHPLHARNSALKVILLSLLSDPPS